MENIISKNPATGQQIHSVPSCNPADVSKIVDNARRAQVSWGAMTVKERVRFLRKARDFMFRHMDEIAADISKNNGKPLVEGLSEVLPMILTTTYLEKNAARILRDQKVGMGGFFPTKRARITYQPMGVIGIISPWNYPLSTPLAEVLPALAAGNSVILKPSEVTGLVSSWIQKIIDSMGLPRDVFTLLPGRGDVGAALASSSVDRIMVTGSVATGKTVMAAASQRLTPVTLELGGKDCMIVLEDANLDAATSAAVVGGLYNAGQTCCSVERLLVHESVAEPFIQKMNEKIARLRIGESKGHDVDIGSITFEGQKNVYFSQVQDHLSNQGKTLFGKPAFDGKSSFMEPLVVEAAEGRKFWTEETFGPVIAVKKFKTDAEAISINNDSPFGLTALIWTKNQKRARRMAAALNVGTVVINDAPFTNAIASLPWGGVKESGFGRVHGEAGLKDMCHTRLIVYDLAGQAKQPWWYPYNKAQYDFLKNYAILLAGKGLINRVGAFFQVIKNALKMGPRI